MTSPPRLTELPFLAAILAMALALALPWVFAQPPEGAAQQAEAGSSLQLASQGGAQDTAQP